MGYRNVPAGLVPFTLTTRQIICLRYFTCVKMIALIIVGPRLAVLALPNFVFARKDYKYKEIKSSDFIKSELFSWCPGLGRGIKNS